MNSSACKTGILLLGLSWLGFSGCSASATNPDRGPVDSTTSNGVAGRSEPALLSAGAPAAIGGGAGSAATAGAAATPGNQTTQPVDDTCASSQPFKAQNCSCRANETAACWTGPAADRNVGKCHDGLQICSGPAGNEFDTWGPCMGEEHDCGSDAGMPPPETECACIPGAVIQCSEDCTVGIICSFTATKTCLPDRTWSTCHEDTGVQLDLPGVQCRNMLHGCLSVLTPGMPAQGEGELYVGDCSKQFECGHAPPPVSPPPTENPN